MIFEFRVWFRCNGGNDKDFDTIKIEAENLEEGKIKAKKTRRCAFCVEEI